MNIHNYWQQPTDEQQVIQHQLQEQERGSQPATMPARYSLRACLEVSEQAIYTTSLGHIVVQNREELGGGYGVLVSMLMVYNHHHHIEDSEVEAVEQYIAALLPYEKDSVVWTPLYHHHCAFEAESYKKYFQSVGKW